MHFKTKKKRYLTVTGNGSVLYDGYWKDVPFTEDIILKKSIEFFNDKEPCAIHRGAVQLRLVAELEELFGSPDFNDRFFLYTGFPADSIIDLSER